MTSANPPTTPAVVRTSPSTTGIARRSNPKKSSERHLLDSPTSALRSSDLGSHEPSFEGTQNCSGPPVGASVDASDSAAVPSAVGSVPDGAMSLVGSAANLFGGPGLLDVHVGPGAAESSAPTVASGTVGRALENSVLPTGDSPAVSDLRGEGSPALVLPAGSRAAAFRDFSSTELLDAAIHADWEAVDGELRQILTRLSGVTGSADGGPSRSLWLAWIGAAGALLLARRASHRGRPLFRRSLTAESSARRRHGPFPVGPWPLGLP